MRERERECERESVCLNVRRTVKSCMKHIYIQAANNSIHHQHLLWLMEHACGKYSTEVTLLHTPAWTNKLISPTLDKLEYFLILIPGLCVSDQVNLVL